MWFCYPRPCSETRGDGSRGASGWTGVNVATGDDHCARKLSRPRPFAAAGASERGCGRPAAADSQVRAGDIARPRRRQKSDRIGYSTGSLKLSRERRVAREIFRM
jgi:hypothetical protein